METAIRSTQESPLVQSRFLIGLKRAQLEGLPWAITKVDRKGVFTYGNRAMREIFGVDSIEGKTIEDVFRGDDLAIVQEHLQSRYSGGVADEYEVQAIRPADSVRVPIRVSAMPDADDSGEIVGSIAVVHDLLASDVSRKIHNAIEYLRESDEILRTAATECERIVPFDMFGVTLYSVDGDHARTLYLYPELTFRPSTRWREMTPYARKLIGVRDVLNVPDFEEWLNRPEWRQYRDDPDTQRFLKMGFRSSISFPVIRGDRVVATLGFARKGDKNPFSQQDQERLARLPLGGAVNLALHYQQVDELKFSRNLMERVASGPPSAKLIARTIVAKIREHYQWENVSIFRPDQQEGVLRLVKQDAPSKKFLLPGDWHHPINQGVTGHVYQTAEALNVPDVAAPEFKNLYLPGLGESRSELCLPIIVDRRVYWLLNIEDSRRNAFAKEEQDTLEGILREVAVVLELVSKNQIFSELLTRSKDAVIQTDLRGVIKQTNPATAELLGYSDEEMRGTQFDNYFKDKNQARRVEEAAYVPNDEVHLLHKDGSDVSLLLSGTSLPKDIGLKIYVCNDLSTRKRMETMEILRHMYNEIATQIKTPLSLAFAWLAKLQKIESQPEAADILAKTIKQLNKVDLSYDRLLFYERHETIAPIDKNVFEIPYIVEQIKQDMPDSESEKVEVIVQPNVPMVRADLFQIWFCLESVLAYLLRFVPEGDKISVNISAQGRRVAVAISGYAPQVTGGAITNYAKKDPRWRRWAIRVITEMALGEEMIKGFVEKNHSGRFSKQRRDADLMEYVIELPGA